MEGDTSLRWLGMDANPASGVLQPLPTVGHQEGRRDTKDWKLRWPEFQNRSQAECRIGEAALLLTLGTAVTVGDRSQASGQACQARHKGCCGLSPPHPPTTFLTMGFIAEVGGAS